MTDTSAIEISRGAGSHDPERARSRRRSFVKHSRWSLVLAAASMVVLGASESGGKGLPEASALGQDDESLAAEKNLWAIRDLEWIREK